MWQELGTRLLLYYHELGAFYEKKLGAKKLGAFYEKNLWALGYLSQFFP